MGDHGALRDPRGTRGRLRRAGNKSGMARGLGGEEVTGERRDGEGAWVCSSSWIFGWEWGSVAGIRIAWRRGEPRAGWIALLRLGRLIGIRRTKDGSTA
jgi:hypothetical protein